LSKELFQLEKPRGERLNPLMAIEILEKADGNKNIIIHKKDKKKASEKSFWSFMNTFKCGGNNN